MKQLVKSLSYILSISLIVFLLPINNTNAATPTYNYEWVSQSGTISADRLAHEYTNLEAGQTLNLSLTLLNRSNSTIKKLSEMGPHGPYQAVAPGVWGIGSQTPHQDGTPHFLDTSSYVVNNNRFVYYNGPDVPNGQSITMSWNIKLASNLSDGVYNLYVRPVSEYLAWTRQIKNGKLLPDTSSDIFWRFVVGEGDFKTYSPNGTDFVFDYPSYWEIKRDDLADLPDIPVRINLGEKEKFYNGGAPITISLHSGANRDIDSAIDWYTNYLGSGRTIFSKSKLNTTYEYKNDYKTVIYQNDYSFLYENFVINEHGFIVQVSFCYTTPSNAEQERGWQAMERIVHSIR